MSLVAKTNNIKIRMIDMEINQQTLADDLKLNRVYINALINGRQNSWRQAYRLSKYLGGTIDDYFIVED
ncbi:helix-turn-helix transcriptional regulator [Mammaliicoccus sciuri]|uniref:helix-turn-helix transcriptional regulator n=1 Tax=Mammaliicoccus sciuri TaxID=1296 RepID=UPI003A8DB088